MTQDRNIDAEKKMSSYLFNKTDKMFKINIKVKKSCKKI